MALPSEGGALSKDDGGTRGEERADLVYRASPHGLSLGMTPRRKAGTIAMLAVLAWFWLGVVVVAFVGLVRG